MDLYQRSASLFQPIFPSVAEVIQSARLEAVAAVPFRGLHPLPTERTRFRAPSTLRRRQLRLSAQPRRQRRASKERVVPAPRWPARTQHEAEPPHVDTVLGKYSTSSCSSSQTHREVFRRVLRAESTRVTACFSRPDYELLE